MNSHKQATGEKLRDFILGIQDGIVNVLGLVLGVASATYETRVVLIAGLAGLVAESVSMGAVAYTSSKAARDYYKSLEKNKKETQVRFAERSYKNPLGIGLFVLITTVLGSIIPLIPFFFMPVKAGIFASIAVSGIVLFIVGAAKGKLTVGNWKKTGTEMLLVGLIAALIGYAVGILLGKI